MHYHEYADDIQLFTKMPVGLPATAAIGLLQNVSKGCNVGSGTMDS